MRSEVVSVCIATYNGSKYLKKQIESILPQLQSTDEIIISDDGSSDITEEIICGFNDARIKFHHHVKLKRSFWHKHASYSATNNFENALRLSKGDIIFLSDQDDIWEDTKVDVALNYLKALKYDLVIHDARIINHNESIIFESLFEYQNTQKGFLHNLKRNTFTGCCMAFKREILHYVMPIPNNVIGHDMWIGMLASFYGKILFVNERLVKYRFHQSNATYSQLGKKNSFPFRVYYRVQFLVYFLLRLLKKII